MKIDISVPEVVKIFREIQVAPEKLFQIMRLDIRKIAGDYLSSLMESELAIHLNRRRYERCGGAVKHSNRYYPREFTVKIIGDVDVKVSRDRKGTFSTSILLKRRQYEDGIAKDLSDMFLAGISTRRLSMISKHLIGRKISHAEISNTNRDLIAAVEK